jgi:hypothetical protein
VVSARPASEVWPFSNDLVVPFSCPFRCNWPRPVDAMCLREHWCVSKRVTVSCFAGINELPWYSLLARANPPVSNITVAPQRKSSRIVGWRRMQTDAYSTHIFPERLRSKVPQRHSCENMGARYLCASGRDQHCTSPDSPPKSIQRRMGELNHASGTQ